MILHTQALTLTYMLLCVAAALVGLRRARKTMDRRYASHPDLTALTADGIASPLRDGEVPSPRLSTAIGHRLLLFVLLHIADAFLAAASSASRLATQRTADVLELAERTASSLMGAFLFLIFGLAKDQILVRHISDAVARLRRREPGAPAPTSIDEQHDVWF